MEDQNSEGSLPSKTIIDAASPETNSALEEKRLLARRQFLLGAVAPIIVTVNARRAFAATGLVCGSVPLGFFAFFDEFVVQAVFGALVDFLSCF